MLSADVSDPVAHAERRTRDGGLDFNDEIKRFRWLTTMIMLDASGFLTLGPLAFQANYVSVSMYFQLPTLSTAYPPPAL